MATAIRTADGVFSDANWTGGSGVAVREMALEDQQNQNKVTVC